MPRKSTVKKSVPTKNSVKNIRRIRSEIFEFEVTPLDVSSTEKAVKKLRRPLAISDDENRQTKLEEIESTDEDQNLPLKVFKKPADLDYLSDLDELSLNCEENQYVKKKKTRKRKLRTYLPTINLSPEMNDVQDKSDLSSKENNGQTGAVENIKKIKDIEHLSDLSIITSSVQQLFQDKHKKTKKKKLPDFLPPIDMPFENDCVKKSSSSESEENTGKTEYKRSLRPRKSKGSKNSARKSNENVTHSDENPSSISNKSVNQSNVEIQNPSTKSKTASLPKLNREGTFEVITKDPEKFLSLNPKDVPGFEQVSHRETYNVVPTPTLKKSSKNSSTKMSRKTIQKQTKGKISSDQNRESFTSISLKTNINTVNETSQNGESKNTSKPTDLISLTNKKTSTILENLNITKRSSRNRTANEPKIISHVTQKRENNPGNSSYVMPTRRRKWRDSGTKQTFKECSSSDEVTKLETNPLIRANDFQMKAEIYINLTGEQSNTLIVPELSRMSTFIKETEGPNTEKKNEQRRSTRKRWSQVKKTALFEKIPDESGSDPEGDVTHNVTNAKTVTFDRVDVPFSNLKKDKEKPKVKKSVVIESSLQTPVRHCRSPFVVKKTPRPISNVNSSIIIGNRASVRADSALPCASSTPISKKGFSEDLRKQVLPKDKVPLRSSSRTKMPDFQKIHARQYQKMENIKDHQERKAIRAQFLLSGCKLLPNETASTSGITKESKKKLRFSPVKNDTRSKNVSLMSRLPKPLQEKVIKRTSFEKILEKKINQNYPKTENSAIPRLASKPIQRMLDKRSKSNKNTDSQLGRNQINIYGFKVSGKEGGRKEEQIKAVATKTKVIGDTRNRIRKEKAVVRTNRRFELLMQMRAKNK
ncbi:hypothetical protein ABEB36_008851 [Hypothenemus hampei]|uniref:Uncharacterized protein n=1 Tax=Hypothenemus hampei TaxID=57062 RepID=A0ABD1EN92_HYPHA